MGTSRPPRPNNVVALSQYRARLGRGRQLRRADALLEAPDLEAAVRALPGDELYYVLHEIGLAEGAEILASATSEQLAVMLDFAIWERDQINPAALGEWLAAIAAAPFERIGRWMKRDSTASCSGSSCGAGRRIYDLTQDEAPDEPEGTFYPTPDGFFVLDVRVSPVVEDGPDPARALIGLVDAMYRTDNEFARRIIVGAIGELDAELEESAYRWRQARMADLGIRRLLRGAGGLPRARPAASASATHRRAPGRSSTRAPATGPRCGCRRRWPSDSATPTARRSRARRKN